MRCCAVHLLSHVQLFVTLYTAACWASLSFTIPQSLLNFMPTELVMLSNHLILCHPLLLLPLIIPSNRVFSNESALHIRWPDYWNSNFSYCPSNEYWSFISFRIDWFDLLAVQGTRKSLLEHYNLKASILQQPVFFMVQLLHPYMTTVKTLTLSIWTSVSKVMSFFLIYLLVLSYLSSQGASIFYMSWL